jgi:uncharacterized protein YbbC (DUF1343 family)
MNRIQAGILVLFISMCSCTSKKDVRRIIPGAERTGLYFHQLKNKNVAVVANHSSLVKSVHLVDTLLAEGISIKRIFSPEHGFRGLGDAGEIIHSHWDEKTGLAVISLYGIRKKPNPEHLKDVDVVVFDLQDVGVRFYTYISTMHYIMEACAETRTRFIVLDRPNPNGFYIDGPVLDLQYRSFVGMHPIPVVYGMTVAELARMINSEGWLKDGIRCDFQWISCLNYTHDSLFQLPVRPSPNLPNMKSVYLYPTLGMFEGTVMQVGRGTGFPFQVFGHPQLANSEIEYIPRSMEGSSQNPKYKDQLCRGIDLRDYPLDSIIDNPGIRLEWLRFAYLNTSVDRFFLPFFNNLSGTGILKEQLMQGESVSSIRESWQRELDEFKKIRKKYLIYKDFKSN